MKFFAAALCRRGVPMAFFPVILLSIAAGGCQQRDGTCPEVDNVEPAAVMAGEAVTVEGGGFMPGHQDLWDDGEAQPPEVWFSLAPNPLMPPEMADLEFDLPADLVVYESESRLEVTTPDMTWGDMAEISAIYGVDMPELPPGLTEIPMGLILHVRNPSGCEVAWDGEVVWNVPVEQEGE